MFAESKLDVSVFANGPGHETFRGVYNSVDVFFKIANALGLGDKDHGHGHEHGHEHHGHREVEEL